MHTTTALYQALTAARCHVGQPVRIALRYGEDAGALRICADARLVSQLLGRVSGQARYTEFGTSRAGNRYDFGGNGIDRAEAYVTGLNPHALKKQIPAFAGKESTLFSLVLTLRPRRRGLHF